MLWTDGQNEVDRSIFFGDQRTNNTQNSAKGVHDIKWKARLKEIYTNNDFHMTPVFAL